MSDQEEARQIYQNHIKEVHERERTNSSSFDKAILTLSTGGLGVSISFISNIVELDTAECIVLLKLAWGLLALAIVATVVSLVVSQYELRRHAEFARLYYVENKEEFLNKKSCLDHMTEALNLLSGVSFVLGTILIVVFVASNT